MKKSVKLVELEYWLRNDFKGLDAAADDVTSENRSGFESFSDGGDTPPNRPLTGEQQEQIREGLAEGLGQRQDGS